MSVIFLKASIDSYLKYAKIFCKLPKHLFPYYTLKPLNKMIHKTVSDIRRSKCGPHKHAVSIPKQKCIDYTEQ